MFPVEAVTSDALEALLFALSVLGVLLLVGVLIRVKIGALRRLFIPAALVAGAVGLALGPYGAGLFPDAMVETWAGLPKLLITVVFAPMLLGVQLPRIRQTYHLIAPQLLFGYLGDFLMIGVPLVVSALLLAPIWGVNEMFGTLVEVGWPGGHGTAGGMIGVYEAQGWSAGGSLGLTSATAGLLVGIVVGMLLINWGVRRGHARLVINSGKVDAGDAADITPESARLPLGHSTLNKNLIETLSFHGSLIAVAILIGWVLQHYVEKLVPGMPLFPLAMIGGAIVQQLIGRTRFNDAIDPMCLRIIQGVALDFLIVAAIASIELPVVVHYAVPFALLMVVAAAVSISFFFWAGPRIFAQDWFEQAIVNFGTMTGVSSVGLMLLRTVDPELETVAARAYALRAPFISPFIGGGLVTALLPALTVSYGAFIIGSCFLAASLVLLLLARVGGLWNPRRRAERGIAP